MQEGKGCEEIDSEIGQPLDEFLKTLQGGRFDEVVPLVQPAQRE